MSKQPGLVDKREHGPLLESDLAPSNLSHIINDENALFASNENIMQFQYFHSKGKADGATEIKIRLQFQIDVLLKQPETQYRNAYIDGLKRAINLIT